MESGAIGSLQFLPRYCYLRHGLACQPHLGEIVHIKLAEQVVENIEEVGGEHDDDAGDHCVDHDVTSSEVKEEGGLDGLQCLVLVHPDVELSSQGKIRND